MAIPDSIWSSPRLPSLPTVAVRLLDVTKNPDSGISEVVDVIKSDPALAAKIIRVANSPMYGLAGKVKSLSQATSLLGRSKVITQVLTFSLTDDSRFGAITTEYDRYWLHSLIAANAAEFLCVSVINSAYDGFLAGLLTNIGQLAVLKAMPNEYGPMLLLSREESLNILDVETEYLGFNHIEVGVKLMENWEMPSSFVFGVEHHHDSLAEVQALPAADRKIAAVAAFGTLVADCLSSDGCVTAFAKLQAFASGMWDMSTEDLHSALEIVGTMTKVSGEAFSIPTDEMRASCDLLGEAMEQMVCRSPID